MSSNENMNDGNKKIFTDINYNKITSTICEYIEKNEKTISTQVNSLENKCEVILNYNNYEYKITSLDILIDISSHFMCLRAGSLEYSMPIFIDFYNKYKDNKEYIDFINLLYPKANKIEELYNSIIEKGFGSDLKKIIYERNSVNIYDELERIINLCSTDKDGFTKNKVIK